ncbi:hypothetical protein EJC51_46470 [Streptomyces aquilus]|uniref:Uncharacterized protein n=1 Tax=Streptomyces aquilus TaxID=2548456 RepID=A0A3Q9C7P4_9ACTN|nr:hypothetical protein [Streptomyces aquilus]AZP22834.1 hypothetical protein EJC51_46470 [Streptomyces aquilus]
MSMRPFPSAPRSPFVSRARRLAAAAAVIGVLSVLAVLLTLLITAGRPEPWWPRDNFTSPTHASPVPAPRREECDLSAGPARTYCEHDTHTTPLSPRPLTPSGHDAARAIWRLVPIGSTLTALIIWRRCRAHARGDC